MSETSYLPSRYERKYLVSEAKARAIREFIRPRVQPDEHLRPDRPEGYPVYSLYLDSPQLSLYQATAQGLLNRFKLRIRYYDDGASTPIFFEVKRRLHQAVRKQRATVKRSALYRVLAGAAPLPRDLIGGAARFGDLDEFCRLRSKLRAVGTLIVGYHREAYFDPTQGKTRITFDRNLRAQPFDPKRGLTIDLPPVKGEEPGVILELKYVDRFPSWMQQLIREFGLERQSVPKYGWSIEAIGEPIVVDRSVTQRWSLVGASALRNGNSNAVRPILPRHLGNGHENNNQRVKRSKDQNGVEPAAPAGGMNRNGAAAKPAVSVDVLTR